MLAKPPVRKFAKDLGVDLSAVAATGPGGIITRDDVQAYATRAEAQTLATYPGDDKPWLADGVVAEDGRRTHVPVRSVRRRTAEAMVDSAFTAPHVTVFHTVDVTRTMKLVARLKEDRSFADVRVTPLLLACERGNAERLVRKTDELEIVLPGRDLAHKARERIVRGKPLHHGEGMEAGDQKEQHAEVTAIVQEREKHRIESGEGADAENGRQHQECARAKCADAQVNPGGRVLRRVERGADPEKAGDVQNDSRDQDGVIAIFRGGPLHRLKAGAHRAASV